MDGLDTNNNGVMVIAATNRFDVLDSALTRPGRFDRVVRVEVPNTAGREAILKVHTRRMNLADSALLGSVAELTPGKQRIRANRQVTKGSTTACTM